ncbi:Transmembrane 7 superfamily member 3, partial [Stegodyphus mimosarum]
MIYKLKNAESKASMWLLNRSHKNISVLIIISTIHSYEPVPGGCNMEFRTEIAPYLRLKTKSGRIYLEYQHANIGSDRNDPPPLCSISSSFLVYEVHVLFLKENDFREEEYFSKIGIMSNLSLLKQHSAKVQTYSVHPDTRISFLMYPDIGVVYNVIAKYTINGEIKEAAYVPVVTYGCNSFDLTEYGCRMSDFFEGKAFLFLLSVYGFFVAFFGPLFIRATMFFFGFLASFFIALVFLGRYSDFSKQITLELAVIIGLIGAGIWLAMWLWSYISLISLLLIGFVFGFLVTAAIFYTPVGNFEIFLNSKNFWALLSSGTLFVAVLFLLNPTVMTVVGSSVVGSYTFLLFYDDFIGTRLAYIVINVVKRAVSENLGFASNDYPFQVKDIIMSSAWVILSLLAIAIQCRKLSPNQNCLCYKDTCCAPQATSSSRQSFSSDFQSLQQPLMREPVSHYRTFYQQ